MARRGFLILLGVQAAAFWPVWGWAAARVRGGDADEIVALLAAAAALLVAPRVHERAGLQTLPLPRSVDALALRKRQAPLAAPAAVRGGARHHAHETSEIPVRVLVLPTLFTIAYAASAALGAPPLLRAMVASCALLATWSAWRWGARPHPAALGLVLLALPALPTAQFVLGFPLRVAAGEIAARMLRLCGLAVVRDGVSLRLGERLVGIDAPCSGVNMLWMALLLALVLAALGGVSTARTAALASAAALLAVAGNGLRAASLFFTESGIVALPGGLSAESVHGPLGVVSFALAVAPLVWLSLRGQRAAERNRGVA
ncbi:MAG TPA: archaeosortase/exosortase family protein [Thermoanaerobaculia bacterium]|nr:archaeosortase/exosortase family protein [Thermoanaerobaculia bacterium]